MEKEGGVEVLEYRDDLPLPTLQPGEILIKNEFAGVNYIDTYFRTGLYKSPNPKPLGQEAAGVIASLSPSGNTHGLALGDRVVALAAHSSGYSEYVATSAAKTYKLPADVPTDIGAAALLQGLTALTMIRESYCVKRGEWILVHAAAGGVGLWLCQLLKVVGARVIATASTKAKLELARENGAEFLINYKEEDFVKRVKEITNGEGAKAIFDGVGASTFEGDLECVARKGYLVSFGNASGAVPPFAIARLGAKNVAVLRPRLFGYIETPEEFKTYCEELFGLVRSGSVNVRIHDRYPLEDVRRAHTDIEGRVTTGKLLLKL